MSKSSHFHDNSEQRKNPKRREEHREERRTTRRLLEEYKSKLEREREADEPEGVEP